MKTEEGEGRRKRNGEFCGSEGTREEHLQGHREREKKEEKGSEGDGVIERRRL